MYTLDIIHDYVCKNSDNGNNDNDQDENNLLGMIYYLCTIPSTLEKEVELFCAKMKLHEIWNKTQRIQRFHIKDFMVLNSINKNQTEFIKKWRLEHLLTLYQKHIQQTQRIHNQFKKMNEKSNFLL